MKPPRGRETGSRDVARGAARRAVPAAEGGREAKVTRFALGHAVRALDGVLGGDAAADKSLSAYFRTHPALGSTDRALIAETLYAVLRRRRSLSAAVGGTSARHLALAALVRLGGLSGRQLESLLVAGEEDLIARIKAFDSGSLADAERADLPDWLWQRLVEERGREAAMALALGMLEPAPLDLRVNSLKGEREKVLEALLADGMAAVPCTYAPDGIRLAGKPALQRHRLFLDGTLEVQDEGSQLLALLVEPRRGEMVVDFCAGAGGKTLALGALMRSSGRLYAFDVSAARLARLKPRLARSGLSNVHPVRIEGENDARVKRLAGKADRVLVDAPCSGLGTLRRNPELKWRQGPADIAEMAAKQSAILASAARLARPGGRLVYATCSILEEENTRVVQGFLGDHADFRLLDARDILARRGVAIDMEDGGLFRLETHRHGTDGFFAAVLERRA